MASLPIDQSATEHVDSRVLRVAAVVFLGPLITQIDSTVVNVSLSTIGHDLHASLDSVQWIISGYLMALALTMPLNAWLVHWFGAKFTCGAFRLSHWRQFFAKMETTINGIIWARVFQGMAGGLLTPMAQMMLARAAGRHMARVMGYTAIPVYMAPLVARFWPVRC
jgi:MFS family permease